MKINKFLILFLTLGITITFLNGCNFKEIFGQETYRNDSSIENSADDDLSVQVQNIVFAELRNRGVSEEKLSQLGSPKLPDETYFYNYNEEIVSNYMTFVVHGAKKYSNVYNCKDFNDKFFITNQPQYIQSCNENDYVEEESASDYYSDDGTVCEPYDFIMVDLDIMWTVESMSENQFIDDCNFHGISVFSPYFPELVDDIYEMEVSYTYYIEYLEPENVRFMQPYFTRFQFLQAKNKTPIKMRLGIFVQKYDYWSKETKDDTDEYLLQISSRYVDGDENFVHNFVRVEDGEQQ